jgi:hypothetical protein
VFEQVSCVILVELDIEYSCERDGFKMALQFVVSAFPVVSTLCDGPGRPGKHGELYSYPPYLVLSSLLVRSTPPFYPHQQSSFQS